MARAMLMAAESPKLSGRTLFRHGLVAKRGTELNRTLSRDDNQPLPFPVHARLSDLDLSPVNRVCF